MSADIEKDDLATQEMLKMMGEEATGDNDANDTDDLLSALDDVEKASDENEYSDEVDDTEDEQSIEIEDFDEPLLTH